MELLGVQLHAPTLTRRGEGFILLRISFALFISVFLISYEVVSSNLAALLVSFWFGVEIASACGASFRKGGWCGLGIAILFGLALGLATTVFRLLLFKYR